MPYVHAQDRAFLDPKIIDLAVELANDTTPGRLNYVITRLCIEHAAAKAGLKLGPDLKFPETLKINYATANEIMGALECAKQEFYRRLVASYEDQKIAENGDVYPTLAAK